MRWVGQTRAKDLWSSERTLRPIHPDVFSLLVHVHLLQAVSQRARPISTLDDANENGRKNFYKRVTRSA